MRFAALPGFRDVFPDAHARRARIFAAWCSVAARYGFEEYDGPPLESIELYTAKSGEEIVGQLYAFTDKGGREVALRPEMTPTLARMVAQHVSALKKPIRWFSMPQLFRYERQQRGRLREHFQLNMDIIGESGPAADAEVIAATIDIVRALGFTSKDVRVRISDRRVLAAALTEGLRVLESELSGVLGAFDRYERSKEAAEKAIAAVVGDERRAHRVREFAAALGDTKSLLDQPAAVHLKQCIAHLEAMGLADSFGMAFAKAQIAAEGSLPLEGTIFVTVNDHDKPTVLPIARRFHEMGFRILATAGTERYLRGRGVPAERVLKVHEGRPNAIDLIVSGEVQLLINTPLGKFTQEDDYAIRRAALVHRVPYTTTMSAASAACDAVIALRSRTGSVRSLQEWHEKANEKSPPSGERIVAARA